MTYRLEQYVLRGVLSVASVLTLASAAPTHAAREGYVHAPPRGPAPSYHGLGPVSRTIPRLVGAILLAQNDEWSVRRARYLTLETMTTLSDDPLVSLPA